MYEKAHKKKMLLLPYCLRIHKDYVLKKVKDNPFYVNRYRVVDVICYNKFFILISSFFK